MIIEFIEQHWPISLVASIFLFQFLAFLYELISDKSAEAKANQRKIDLEKEYQQKATTLQAIIDRDKSAFLEWQKNAHEEIKQKYSQH